MPLLDNTIEQLPLMDQSTANELSADAIETILAGASGTLVAFDYGGGLVDLYRKAAGLTITVGNVDDTTYADDAAIWAEVATRVI